MRQQDFLLKEIEKISQVLIALIDKITGLGADNFENGIEQIDHSLKEQFDFDILALIELDEGDLLLKLESHSIVNVELLLELIIEIIKKNNLIKDKQQIDSKMLISKGLLIINYLNSKSKDYSIYRNSLHQQLLELKGNE